MPTTTAPVTHYTLALFFFFFADFSSNAHNLAFDKDKDGGLGARFASLRIGELPPEMHFRFGAIPAQKKRFALPSLRGPGPPMLIHSKGLATLTDLLPELYRRANAKRSTADATATQLLDAMGGGTPEERQNGEAIVYSPRTLAGFCALLGGGGLFAEPFGHLYAYGRPDVLGVESWILPVYFAGGPSVALVSRWLRRGAGGGAGG